MSFERPRRQAPLSASGFSIGDAAAIIGVSTHVLRSWERRLSLSLNHRTQSNQRRYRIEDIHRFMAIRQLHERAGLPLIESAQKVLQSSDPPSESPDVDSPALGGFWAGLIHALPDIVLVIDRAGRVTAANEAATAKLDLRIGSTLMRLAPVGWRPAYESIYRNRAYSQRTVLAMRGRTATVFVDARVEPIRTGPDGPMVLVGSTIERRLLDQHPKTVIATLDG